MSNVTTSNAATDETLDQVKQLQVVSTPSLKVADTEHVISWSRRSTEKTPVAETERYRAVTVSKDSLKVPHDACNSTFYALLQSTVHKLADASFAAWATDNMMATSVDAARFSLPQILAFWADKKAAETVDAAKIVAFLKTSATLASLPEKLQAVWLSKLPKIAAPSYKQTFTKEQCAAIVAKIVEADTDNAVCIFIMQRANNVIAAVEVSEEL